MLCLTQTTGHAIRALGCLGGEGSQPRLIREVAARSGVSKPYLAKIFNKLASSGLIVSKRGYRGGIALARPANQVALLEIVKAVEGERWIGPCLLGISECASHATCPTSAAWKQISREIETVLKTTTLAAIVEAIKKAQPATLAEKRRRPAPHGSEDGGFSNPMVPCRPIAQAQ